DWVFGDVRGDLFRRRRDPGEFPPALEVAGEINRAMREEGCRGECRGFRDPLALLHVDAARMDVEFVSASLSPEVGDAIVRELLELELPQGRTREGILTTDAGGLLPEPVVV